MEEKREIEDMSILLDKQTSEDLKTLIQSIKELQTRLQIIVSIYVRANNKEGNYRISEDLTKLERIEDSKCKLEFGEK